MKTLDEADVLAYDPFDGDFGEPGDRTLLDKMATARKSGPCHLCDGEIVPGERVRRRTDIADGEMMSFRWCNACCVAMAKSEADGADAVEARAALRRTRAVDVR